MLEIAALSECDWDGDRDAVTDCTGLVAYTTAWADDGEDAPCSWCGGEWYLQECDDPIQCCEPRCDGQFHPCTACQGTGLAKHQVIW